jgi:hypothetical protein
MCHWSLNPARLTAPAFPHLLDILVKICLKRFVCVVNHNKVYKSGLSVSLMDGMDLRKFQKDGEEKDKVKELFGKILSGKAGYTTVLDESKPSPKCECGFVLDGCEKFCPECGTKLVCGEANKNCEIE